MSHSRFDLTAHRAAKPCAAACWALAKGLALALGLGALVACNSATTGSQHRPATSAEARSQAKQSTALAAAAPARPALPAIPSSAKPIPPEVQPASLAALAAKPGLFNMIRGVGGEASGQGLEVQISAVLTDGTAKSRPHIARLAGQQGRVHGVYSEPIQLQESEVFWQRAGFHFRPWNEPTARPVTFRELDYEPAFQLVPMIFVDIKDRWDVVALYRDSIDEQKALLLDIRPTDQGHPFDAGRLWLNPETALPRRGWFRSSDGAEYNLRFYRESESPSTPSLSGFDVTESTTGITALVSIKDAQAIATKTIPTVSVASNQ